MMVVESDESRRIPACAGMTALFPIAARPAAGRSWTSPSFIDRRFGIHEKRDDVLDLRLGQDALVPEARHVRACAVRFGVEDLAVRVPAGLVVVAAELAELIERGTDGAERHFLRRELMTGVAVRAGRGFGIVRVLHAATL